MSDRISELIRQKQLLQEHLNWLDQEIARAAATAALQPGAPATPPSRAPTVTAMPPPADMPVPAPKVAAPLAPSAPVVPPSATLSSSATSPETPNSSASVETENPEAMRMADEIIARYQHDEALRPEDTKRGCLILAGAVFVLMAAAFLISYWFFYRSHR